MFLLEKIGGGESSQLGGKKISQPRQSPMLLDMCVFLPHETVEQVFFIHLDAGSFDSDDPYLNNNHRICYVKLCKNVSAQCEELKVTMK